MELEAYDLTIVATTRNDDHGGDMLRRTRLFVRGLLHQTRRYQVRSELIIVEWNPPADQPLLREVLPQPEEDDFLSIRYVIVPASVHSQLQYAERIPLFQMIAKNVGIRRAKGRFVLCTNVDLLFSDALFKQLAGNKLREGIYYRCIRADVPKAIPYERSIPEILTYCKRNVLQRLGKDIYLSKLLQTAYWFFLHTLGYFIPWWREAGLHDHPHARRLKMQLIRLDTDACGDFTLMSKKDWLEIEGYAELEAYSIHIDSLALMVAAALGKRQQTFRPSACTYHVTHEDGWVLADPIRKLHKDIERPMLDWSTVRQTGVHLLQHKTRLGLNAANWGFADHDFTEYIYTPQT